MDNFQIGCLVQIFLQRMVSPDGIFNADRLTLGPVKTTFHLLPGSESAVLMQMPSEGEFSIALYSLNSRCAAFAMLNCENLDKFYNEIYKDFLEADFSSKIRGF